MIIMLLFCIQLGLLDELERIELALAKNREKQVWKYFSVLKWLALHNLCKSV